MPPPFWHCPPKCSLTPIATVPCGLGEVGPRGQRGLCPAGMPAPSGQDKLGISPCVHLEFSSLGQVFLETKPSLQGLGHDLCHSRETAGVLRPEVASGGGESAGQWSSSGPPTQQPVWDSHSSHPPKLFSDKLSTTSQCDLFEHQLKYKCVYSNRAWPVKF